MLLDGQALLPMLAILLLGLAVSIAVAVTVANEGPVFAIPFMLAIPAVVLLARYPFSAVMIWLIVFPFVARGTSGLAVPVYYAVHRAMIPGVLWFVLVSSWIGARKRPFAQFSIAEFVMGLSLLWAIGSIYILGEQQLQMMVNLYDRWLVPYCMYWLIRLFAPTAEDLKRLLPAAFITLITQATIGILSWFVPSTLPKQWLGEAGERVVGTFRNPAVFTTTVIFLALLLFQYWINSKSAWRRTLALLIIGLAFFCTFISFSRGSWLGGAFVLLGLTLVYPKVMLRVEIVGLTLAFILFSTVLTHEIDFAIQRLNDQSTVDSRLLTGAKSLGMIEQKPVFGWGYGNYDRYDDAFRITTIDPSSIKESDHTSHNTYFTIMAEQGIPALALYLFPTLWWLVVSLATWRRLPRQGFWSVSLLTLLWLLILDHFIVSNFMDMIRFNWFGTTIYWMALALIATLVAPPTPATVKVAENS